MARILPVALAVAVGLACASSPTGPETGVELDFDGLVAALRRSGVQVTAAGSISQPFLGVPGRIIVVSGENVQVFEYPDAAAAQADGHRVSPDGGSVGTTLITWVAPPQFYLRGRVLALYVGSSAPVVTALTAVMGPQIAGS